MEGVSVIAICCSFWRTTYRLHLRASASWRLLVLPGLPHGSLPAMSRRDPLRCRGSGHRGSAHFLCRPCPRRRLPMSGDCKARRATSRVGVFYSPISCASWQANSNPAPALHPGSRVRQPGARADCGEDCRSAQAWDMRPERYKKSGGHCVGNFTHHSKSSLGQLTNVCQISARSLSANPNILGFFLVSVSPQRSFYVHSS